MRLLLQVIVSCLIVAGVLWWMWRLPRRGEGWLLAGPLLALASVWAGVAAVVASGLLWWVVVADELLVVVLLALDPAALATGVLVQWIYRSPLELRPDEVLSVARQRQQAWVGIALGLVAVAVGYVFVMTHKKPFTPVGM